MYKGKGDFCCSFPLAVVGEIQVKRLAQLWVGSLHWGEKRGLGQSVFREQRNVFKEGWNWPMREDPSLHAD